ncbi:MAG: MBL fold metallo-hydrolase [Desulfobacterales bacterium]|nr:MBL fold metallo-hydrolase [Desulfobacterales bacterium]
MKITNEIYQVGGGTLTSPEDAAIYLINFNDQAALVDAGCGGAENKLLKNIAACGIRLEQIQYLLITHCHFDHTGGAKSLSDKCRCKIVAHELDAAFLEEGNNTVTAANWYGSTIAPFMVDRKLKGSLESINLGERTIQAIHTPGHSPGSVVYLTESEGLKVLFAQDVHGPLDRSFMSVKKDYLKSLELLLSLEADILCEGHFGIYKGKKKVKNFIKQFLK